MAVAAARMRMEAAFLSPNILMAARPRQDWDLVNPETAGRRENQELGPESCVAWS